MGTVLVEHALELIKLMGADNLTPADFVFELIIAACVVCAIEIYYFNSLNNRRTWVNSAEPLSSATC